MRSIALKYVPTQLTRKDKKKQKKEILKSRRLYKKKLYHTRKKVPSYNSKKSKHIVNAENIYKTTIVPSKELANKTGCSVSALNDIVKKGQGAYYSSGSRPNQTAHSWAYARLASSISGGKAAAVDYHILKKGCKKTSKALKLANKSKKKHKTGTRKIRKYKDSKKGGTKLNPLKTTKYIMKSICKKKDCNNLPMEPKKPETMDNNTWKMHLKYAKETSKYKGIPDSVLREEDKEIIANKARQNALRKIKENREIDSLIKKTESELVDKLLPNVKNNTKR